MGKTMLMASAAICVQQMKPCVRAVQAMPSACVQVMAWSKPLTVTTRHAGQPGAMRNRRPVGQDGQTPRTQDTLDFWYPIYESHPKEQKFTDRWMEKISNLEGRSLVLHCCTGTVDAYECSERLACANLE